MEDKTVFVSAISCGHCSNTIKGELKELEGVLSVEADPVTKEVTVHWELPVTWDEIQAKLNDIGYPVDAK